MIRTTRRQTSANRAPLAAAPLAQAQLSDEDERRTIHLWRTPRDHKALQKLVMANMRLIVAITKRYRHFGIPIDDLIQEGSIAVMRAADRFDPDRGTRFSTYAVWHVRAAIRAYVYQNARIVRAASSSSQRNLFFQFLRLKAKTAPGHRAACNERERLARNLSTSIRAVDELEIYLSGRDVSLNAPFSNSVDSQLQDIIPDERSTPEELLGDIEEFVRIQQHIRYAIDKLDKREQRVIHGRYLSEDRSKLAEIAHEFGVSKERVRQIEVRALGKLKSILEERACAVPLMPLREHTDDAVYPQ
jgi:RNA polymerase sigma-32 factor